MIPRNNSGFSIFPLILILCLQGLFNFMLGNSSGGYHGNIYLFPGENRLRIDFIPDNPDTPHPDLYIVIIPAKGGDVLWEGRINPVPAKSGDEGIFTATIDQLKPTLWTPLQPFLYVLQLKLKKNDEPFQVIRFGFRTISTSDGKILINGKPVFLRGIAINPPGRGIPAEVERSREFAMDYVSYMKSLNVNIIRIPDDEVWYDVCDELGMMVFGGNYSALVMGQNPPEDYQEAVEWYKYEKFGPITHHPSLMIYALTNEVPYEGDIAQQWLLFLKYAYRELRAWDPDRLFIGNAGYGYGKSGDICDLHRYWGWYYASPFTFLNIRDFDSITFPDKIQPITFTECVGNYTGPDGRYNLTPNHKNPVSQLCWTGHVPQKFQAQYADRQQIFTLKYATELFRRLRVINPELSGVFPFTIMFYNWHTVKNFSDMGPKPVTGQVRISYQPVLLSWENWTPNIYSGSELVSRAHIVNDSEDGLKLTGITLHYELRDLLQRTIIKDSSVIPDIPYYGTHSQKILINIPPELVTGYYQLAGWVFQGTRMISENRFTVFIADRQYARPSMVHTRKTILYDPAGKTEKVLKENNISYKKLIDQEEIDPGSFLIIGEDAVDSVIARNKDNLDRFINHGGRVLLLKQSTEKLSLVSNLLPVSIAYPTMDLDDPSYPPPERPSYQGCNINPERLHVSIFDGLDKEKLEMWSDYTGWDESKPGFPAIYPVTGGFILKNKDDLSRTAVLANYSVGLEGIALAEMFMGSGSVMVSGFEFVNRIHIDPVASRLFTNIISYMSDEEEHILHPLVTKPVQWGDYESEAGLLTGIYSGLILNTYPVLTGSYRNKPIIVLKEGHILAERGGGWNNRAGIQYCPYGRRPFGPYVHAGFGGVPAPAEYNENIGTGKVWMKIPPEKNRIINKIWNPSDEDLTILISINDILVGKHSIEKGKTVSMSDRFTEGDSNIKLTFTGDRKLVLLETSFE